MPIKWCWWVMTEQMWEGFAGFFLFFSTCHRMGSERANCSFGSCGPCWKEATIWATIHAVGNASDLIRLWRLLMDEGITYQLLEIVIWMIDDSCSWYGAPRWVCFCIYLICMHCFCFFFKSYSWENKRYDFDGYCTCQLNSCCAMSALHWPDLSQALPALRCPLACHCPMCSWLWRRWGT